MLPLMIDVRLSLSSCSTFRAARIPIRTPAVVATDNGLLAVELAAGIQRVKREVHRTNRSDGWNGSPALSSVIPDRGSGILRDCPSFESPSPKVTDGPYAADHHVERIATRSEACGTGW